MHSQVGHEPLDLVFLDCHSFGATRALMRVILAHRSSPPRNRPATAPRPPRDRHATVTRPSRGRNDAAAARPPRDCLATAFARRLLRPDGLVVLHDTGLHRAAWSTGYKALLQGSNGTRRGYIHEPVERLAAQVEAVT